MPDSMIERVARAMCEAAGDCPDFRYHGETGDPVWRGYEPQARAAVEALREPTEAMQREGAAVLFLAGGETVTVAASLVWPAMINAILAEGQPASPAPATEGGHG